MSGLLAGLVVGVPVEPDRAQAREWLAEELSGREYREAQGSWLQQVWNALYDWFSDLRVPGLGTSWTGVLVVVLLLAAVVAVVLLVAGPLRRTARANRPDAVFEAGPEPSSAHFARADAAAAASDWTTAVTERFRGLVRSLEERTLIERRPGRTAHEVSLEASDPLPAAAVSLARAARTFDDVRYGGRAATMVTDADLRRVVDEVAATRPQLHPADHVPTGTAGRVP